MADAGKQFGPVVLTASAASVATVASSTTFHLLGIIIANGDTSTRTVSVSYGTDGGVGASMTRILDTVSIPARTTLVFNGYLGVFAAAAIIQAFADVTQKCTITLTGVYET